MTNATQEWEIKEEPELHPEDDAVEIAEAAWTQPTARDQALESYRARVDALVPTDDVTVKSCSEFVEQCKLAAKRVEEKRVAKTAPLNKQVDEINQVYMPVRDAFKAMALAITVRVNKFIDDRKKAADLEQQKRIADAKRLQDELDRKAREAREAAAAAEANGNGSKASVLEMKADILEQKAADVVPVHVELPSSKIELESSTVSFGGAKKIWSLPGWDKKKPLRVNDPALLKLVGDLSKLPAGIQFILQHADLNPVYLNASYKGGMKFPEPFVETNDYSKSTVRG